MINILRKIFAFAGKRGKNLTRSIILSFIGALFSALQFFALMVVLTAVIDGDTSMTAMWIALGIMLLSILGKAATVYFSNNSETETGFFMVADKRIHIGDRLRYIPMGYFNKNSLGNITAVVTTTLSDVENSAARSLVLIFGGLLSTAAIIIMMFFADWRIALLALAGLAVYLIVTEISQRQAKKTGPARQKAQETLVENVLEHIQGMSVVKSYGLEKDNNQAVQKAIDDSSRKALSLEYSVVPWQALQQLTVRVFSIAVAALSVILYFADPSFSLAYCLLFLIAAFMIFKELENGGNMSSMLQMLDASMDKANEIDKTPVMDTDGEDVIAKDGSVSFENVSFSYGDNKILDNVSLTIPAKTTAAIVGPSGGGKTTMCNLIARFWDVQEGTIKVGGRDVRDYKLDSLMKNISMVFQNVYLFNDTIENNIKFGKPDATHEEVVAAAKAACCDEFISALPDGYNTQVGEGGSSLSGGEKQRISIARAMLKDAPIVILDEATASVDPENEAQLQQAIGALTHDKTIIMIAHRLKTVRNADQIFVLSGGHIVQSGTHEQLAAQKGVYSDFLNARKEAVGWKLA